MKHNDIKPQNFLVKSLNGPHDLKNLEIMLTDFGLAGDESKGGTPIFAAPEVRFQMKGSLLSVIASILFMLIELNFLKT